MSPAPNPAVELEAPGMIGADDGAIAYNGLGKQAAAPVGANIVEGADGAVLTVH